MDSNYDDIQYVITSIASKITETLGIYPFKMDLPILTSLETFKSSSMLLGNTMNILIFILSCQSIILIYSLMSQNVQQKKF